MYEDPNGQIGAYVPANILFQTMVNTVATTNLCVNIALTATGVGAYENNRLHYTLDNAGNRVKEEVLDESGSLKRTLSRVYDQLGQLQTQKDAGNHATTFTYDANSNPTR